MQESHFMGKSGDKVFITSSGRGEFKTYQLINAKTNDQIDMFFDSEEEAKNYADKRKMILVKN